MQYNAIQCNTMHNAQCTMHNAQSTKLTFWLAIFLLINMHSFSQTQNRTWVIPGQLISFNPSPTATPLLYTTSSGGYNAMQDANGNLLFYIMEGWIFDANNNEIGQFVNNSGETNAVGGYPEVCIVPVPGSCTKFYIIAAEATTHYATSSNPSTFYVTLDMSLPNPNAAGAFGALVGPNSTEIVPSYQGTAHSSTMHLAVSRLRTSTSDRFLFVSDNSILYRCTITSAGIGNLTTLGYMGSGNSTLLKSEMELFEDALGNYKLTDIEWGPNSKLVIYNLNSLGNIVGSSTSVLITPLGGVNGLSHGLEFSPNGQYIYVTSTTAPYIQYVNVATMAILPLTQATNLVDFKDSQIELGYDGKLYFAAANRMASLTGSDNPGTAIWNNSELNVGVPLVAINGQTLRILQDQIDGEDYSNVTNSSPQCCQFNSQWNKIDFTANTGTATWNSTANPLNGSGAIAKVQGTLTIPAGANITIQGMTVQFGLDGKITIQPGGKLTINGTTLTGNTTCQNMWQGVEVLGTGQYGSPNANQQGQFISLNNCLIERANIGVANGAFNMTPPIYIGGYISCTQTIFNNCRYGFQMASHNYNSNYSSLIQSCSFTSTALWYPYANTRSIAHVQLYDVRGGSTATAGVDIVFHNTVGHSTFNNADYGITCLDDQNINMQFLDFTNCGKGVSSARAFSSLNTGNVISNLTFNSCYTSVNLSNSMGDIISNNSFNANGTSQNINFYGIYSDGSSDFHITDNSFKRTMYGIYCNNSGSVGGRISSNSGTGNIFHECWRGIDCRGDNQNLQIKCNQFWNISQPGNEFSTAWYVGGDLADQGNANGSSGPAGNEFYRAFGRKDIYSLSGIASTNCPGVNFCYYRHSTPSSCIPLIYTPIQVSVNNTLISKNQTSCTGQGLMATSGNDVENAKNLISQEVDPVKQQLWVNELVAWYQQQQMETDAKAYLESRYDDAAKQLLFPLYIANNQLAQAQDILNYYCSQSDPESEAYCNLNSIILRWTQNGISPFEMDENDKSRITDVANGTTGSGPQAQVLLKMVYNETIEPWVPSDTGNARFANPFEDISAIPQFEIFPNPVKNGLATIQVNYEGEVTSMASVRIINALGKLISTNQYLINDENKIDFPVNQLKDGVYFIEIDVLNNPTSFGKLLIQQQ